MTSTLPLSYCSLITIHWMLDIVSSTTWVRIVMLTEVYLERIEVLEVALFLVTESLFQTFQVRWVLLATCWFEVLVVLPAFELWLGDKGLFWRIFGHHSWGNLGLNLWGASISWEEARRNPSSSSINCWYIVIWSTMLIGCRRLMSAVRILVWRFVINGLERRASSQIAGQNFLSLLLWSRWDAASSVLNFRFLILSIQANW